nr:MAG TPA: hypothetical protein [Caudoviricetes sp.]
MINCSACRTCFIKYLIYILSHRHNQENTSLQSIRYLKGEVSGQR